MLHTLVSHTHTHTFVHMPCTYTTQSIIQKREELRALTQPREKGEEREGERSREGERLRGEEGVKEESPSPHTRVLVTSPHTKPSSPPTSHKTPLSRHKSAPSHSRRANSAKRKVSHEGLVTAATSETIVGVS